jgi:hypothetical protein
VLFYPVPAVNPNIPYPTPFCSRVWDALDREPETVLGTQTYGRQFYGGPLPPLGFRAPSGTADQWENGCSFEVWEANGYTKGCPNFILPMAVFTVVCDDDSLYCDPTTGDVILHINLSHPNTWVSTQTFQSAGVDGVPAIIRAAAGQTANLLIVQDNSLNNLVEINGDGTMQLESGLIVNCDSNPNAMGLDVKNVTRQFAISNSGQILTNQATGDMEVGSQVATLPIYSPDGSFIGVIPIYTPPVTVLLEDSFIDGIEETCPPHEPDIGGPWVALTTGRVIQDAEGFGCAQLNGELSIIVADVATGNGTGTIQFAADDLFTAGNIGIVFRASDVNNYYLCSLDCGAGAFYLIKFVAGVLNLIASASYSGDLSEVTTMHAVCSADSILCSIEGGPALSVSDAFNVDATLWGLRFNVVEPAGSDLQCYNITVTNP